jgi:cystathionine beta-lyase/cystathionine gamma-synthase
VKLPPSARFSTVCVHAGQDPDPSTGAIITPIFQTSTYVQDELGRHKGYEYARTQNPTRAALERNVAAIEGTFRLFEKVLTKYGLSFSYVDTSNLDHLRQAIRPETRMVFLETPTNPVMRLTDITAAAQIAHTHSAIVVVDNTFASPCVQRPIELGADVVVHSTTKYLNGHSDSVGGIVIAVSDVHLEWLKFIQNAEGAILSPFDSWLVLRGTKTLALRMAQHNINGLALAEFLSTQPAVKQVLYPGLPTHPQHDLAKRQMRGFGGMLSFDAGTFENARRVCNRVKLMALAESLGGVETLICHPASMTHASVPPERRLAIGLTDSLVRISVGVEDPQDLIEDLKQALEG